MQTVKFQPWEHLLRLLNFLLDNRFVIVLKARQNGISWLVCIFCLWRAKFSQNVKVLMLSQKEETAHDLIAKCKFIDSHLPDFLREKRDPDQLGCIGFPSVSSEIHALPSTQEAGRSTDATIVFCDEWEYHPEAEANFAALKPTVDAGGQFIAVSTADTTRLNTFFKAKYREAKAGFSSFKPLFFSWRERPDRNQDWYNEVVRDLAKHRVQGEYPETEEDALSTVKTLPYFDNDKLGYMLQGCIEPLKSDFSAQYKTVKIYKEPQVGKRYIVCTDPSDGKEDPHATIVEEEQSGEWAALSHGMIPADYCAQVHDALVRYYNNAFNSYELNSRGGGIFSAKIDELDTPNRAPFINTDGSTNPKKKGWWTGKKMKDTIEQYLEEAVRLGLIRIYYPPAIKELMAYYRPEGEDPQAPEGGHDDFIIAGGGARILRKYIPHDVNYYAQSYVYRETM